MHLSTRRHGSSSAFTTPLWLGANHFATQALSSSLPHTSLPLPALFKLHMLQGRDLTVCTFRKTPTKAKSKVSAKAFKYHCTGKTGYQHLGFFHLFCCSASDMYTDMCPLHSTLRTIKRWQLAKRTPNGWQHEPADFHDVLFPLPFIGDNLAQGKKEQNQ